MSNHRKVTQEVFRNAEYGYDKFYHDMYESLINEFDMSDNEIRRMRFWNLLKWYMWNKHIDLPTAECGVFRGLSSAMMQMMWPQEHHVIDSFEGLSQPTDKDGGTIFKKGRFACDLETVKKNLSSWGAIEFHKGWIPDVFDDLDDSKWYRFVHIDVDLYEPITAALAYFWPRVCEGGVIVVDDYGYRDFPGAKRAVIEFCQDLGISWVPLNTGNAVILK